MWRFNVKKYSKSLVWPTHEDRKCCGRACRQSCNKEHGSPIKIQWCQRMFTVLFPLNLPVLLPQADFFVPAGRSERVYFKNPVKIT